MHIIADALVELGRIGSLPHVLHEMRTAATMLADSFRFEATPFEEGSSECHTTAVFMPGFFANADYYRRFVHFFHTRGVRLVTPDGLVHNIISWEHAHRLLSRTVKEIEDASGEIPILIGHSKGGTDITGILREHEEVRDVVLIASPLRGTSLNALHFCMTVFHRSPGRAIDEDVLGDSVIRAKITTVVSFSDRIVPPHEAYLPGVKREIVVQNGGDVNLEDRWDSHTGLPYHARHELLKCIRHEEE